MKTCLIGLPASGKSTALAALWFTVAERSDRCDWYVASSQLPRSLSAWNELRDRWLAGMPLDRTEHQSIPDSIKLKLTSMSGGDHAEILVPDIAGEDFSKIYEDGKFPVKHRDMLRVSDRLLLFINVSSYSHPVVLRANSDVVVKDQTPIDWTEADMHVGSKLVAVLRGIKEMCSTKMPLISVVLTAWDLVEESTLPSQVLDERFPLVSQFLECNFDVEVRGLSSQGYDYSINLEDAGVELDEVTRIKVIEPDGSIHHDISRIFT